MGFGSLLRSEGKGCSIKKKKRRSDELNGGEKSAQFGRVHSKETKELMSLKKNRG